MWIGTNTDIDEQKLFEERLKIQLEKQIKIDKQKDEFINIASHELRTPMTSIKASIQILEKLIEPQSGKVKMFIDKLNGSVKKMQYIIDDLLNPSKVDVGYLTIIKDTFNLSDLINESLSHIDLIGRHTLTITGDKGVRVFADYNHLEQVINNLINNAIKYSPESKTVILNVEKQLNRVEVSIQGFGIGVSPEQFPQLFNWYYRVEISGVQISGLGLGLYIYANIIKLHGGGNGC